MPNESDECLTYSHTRFQRILKISGKKIKSNRNGGLETASVEFTEQQYTTNKLFEQK